MGIWYVVDMFYIRLWYEAALHIHFISDLFLVIFYQVRIFHPPPPFSHRYPSLCPLSLAQISTQRQSGVVIILFVLCTYKSLWCCLGEAMRPLRAGIQ